MVARFFLLTIMQMLKKLISLLLLILTVGINIGAKSITKTYSAREIYQAISENFQMSEGYFFDDLPTGILEEDPFLPFCFVGYVYATYNSSDKCLDLEGDESIRFFRNNRTKIKRVGIQAASNYAKLKGMYKYNPSNNKQEEYLGGQGQISADISLDDKDICSPICFEYEIDWDEYERYCEELANQGIEPEDPYFKIYSVTIEYDTEVEPLEYTSFRWNTSEFHAVLDKETTFPTLEMGYAFHDLDYNNNSIGKYNSFPHLSFKSSSQDIAQILPSGKIIPLAPGTTVITAYADSTKFHPAATASFTLTVSENEEGEEGVDAEKTVELTLQEPNTLQAELTELETLSIEKLTLHGKVGSQDLTLLHKHQGRLSDLKILDIHDVELVADDGQYATALGGDVQCKVYYSFYLSEREDTVKTNGTGGLGTSYVNIDVYTMQLNGLFQGNETLKKVLLPESSKYIGRDMFAGCTSLRSITLPDAVDEVKENAFQDCTNLSIFHSKPLKRIGANAFENTSIAKIDLSEVTYMGQEAFRNTKVYNIDLTNLTEIPDDAFHECKSLVNVKFSDRLHSIGQGAFESTQLVSINLPEGLHSIDYAAFSSTLLSDISLPGSVRDIAYSAFDDTPWSKAQEPGIVYLDNVALFFNGKDYPQSLSFKEGTQVISNRFCHDMQSKDITSVTLPTSIKWIGDYGLSFYNLNNLTLPEGLEHIGEYAFEKTKIKSITIPQSVKQIEKYAFAASELIRLTINNGIVGSYAFSNTKNLEKVTIGKSVTLGNGAFSSCPNLISVTFETRDDDDEFRINDGLFYGCESLSAIELPQSTRYIGDEAFSETKISKIVIPELVDSVGNAFRGCKTIREITLPKGLKSLGIHLFSPDVLENGLTIYNYMPVPYVYQNVWYPDYTWLRFVTKDMTMYVLPEAYDAYNEDASWNNFQIMPMGIDGIENVTLPEGKYPDAPIYDLQGRIIKDNPTGIFIRNGKKMRSK